jgi:hypothetical protein
VLYVKNGLRTRREDEILKVTPVYLNSYAGNNEKYAGNIIEGRTIVMPILLEDNYKLCVKFNTLRVNHRGMRLD